MIVPVEGAPEGVVALRAVGEVKRSDYTQVLEPALERLFDAGQKARFVYVLGPDFDGYQGGAMWEDTKVWMEHAGQWERCAVVTSHDWIRRAVQSLDWMIGAEVRVFPVDELDAALTWAAGPS